MNRMFVDYCSGLVDLKQGKLDSVEARLAAMGSTVKLARGFTDSIEIPLQFNFYGKALRAGYLLAAGRPGEIDAHWGGGS